MVSPACEIKEGAGAYASTDDGFDATPAATITIHLIDSSADSWSISCITTDETSNAAAVTAALTINTAARTASFTAPAAGKTYRFRSVVNGGVNRNGRVDSTYSTTFCVYTLTAGGDRVIAADETTEGNSTFGWIGPINSLIRGGGGGGTGLPPDWYDPSDYGAVFDGVTDDLPAFEAMHTAIPATGGYVHMPAGMAYLSDSWRISKPIHLVGHGGNGQGECGFEVAPGRTALHLDPSTISGDGNTAQGAVISSIDIESKLMIHPTATGNALGMGLPTWYAAADVRNGDLYVAAAGANPTLAYRAGSAGTFGGSEPTWNTTIGGTTVHNGITFTTESVPSVRQNSTAYTLGQRVFADADNRYIYKCSTAGTTAGSVPAAMASDVDAVGVQINGTVADGTVVWDVELAAGIYVKVGLGSLKFIYGRGITGAIVHLVGGVAQDAEGITNSDNFVIDELTGTYCGLVMHAAGDDSNAYAINRIWGIGIGTLLPTPAIALAAGYTGLGGHIFHCHSIAGGEVRNLYAQLSTGRPILKTGLGRMTCVSCYTELPVASYCKSVGYATSLGGTADWTDDSNVLVLKAEGCRGIAVLDETGAIPLNINVDLQDGATAFRFTSDDETGNGFAWQYKTGVPDGYWAFNYGAQGRKTIAYVTGANAHPDPGAGLMGFPYGILIGSPYVGGNFIGSVTAKTDTTLRGGIRQAGDVFSDGTTDVRVRDAGKAAPSWAAATAYVAGNATWGIQPDVVSPTTTYALRDSSVQVWKCLGAGTSGGSEPTWPGSPTVGVTTVADGTAEWIFMGYSAPYDVEQTTPKASASSRRVSVETTTATADQVIFSGGVVNGIDFALPDNAVVRVTDLITLHKPGTANGGVVEVRSDWVRNGSTPVQLGATSVSYSLAGIATQSTLTMSHAANGNRIELLVSPQTAETVNHRVYRLQAEGID